MFLGGGSGGDGAGGGGSGSAGLGFEPPEFWSFPPSFTLQPVQETREKQLKLWTALMLQWAQASRTWSLVPSQCPIWDNPSIDRSLPEAGRQAVIAELVAQGHAEWEAVEEGEVGSTGRLRLMWRTVAEVAAELLNHVLERGMVGTVYTVYELHSGDDASGTPFHQMDPWLLRRAIQRLEEQGRAALFEGATSDAEGVKFFDG